MRTGIAAAAAALLCSSPLSAAIILDQTGVVIQDEFPVQFGIEFKKGLTYRLRVEFFGDLTAFSQLGEFNRYGRILEELEDGGINDQYYNDYTYLSPADGRVFEVVDGFRPLPEVQAGLFLVLVTFPATGVVSTPPLRYRVTISDNRPEPGPAVPEPATWAMMIGGFGLVGATARRRMRAKIAFA